MMIALIVKNKLCFVDGISSKSPENDSLFNSWIRCNTMVLSYILNSLRKEIATSLIFIEFAADVWKDLLVSFNSKTLFPV